MQLKFHPFIYFLLIDATPDSTASFEIDLPLFIWNEHSQLSQ